MRKLRKILVFILLIIIPFTYLEAQMGTDLDANQLRLIKKTTIGEKVPTTTLENRQGLLVSLDLLLEHNDTTYLYFWASWNQDCIEEIAKIEQKKDSLPSNVKIIYVSYEDNKQAWIRASKKIKFVKDSYFINPTDTILLPFISEVMDFDGTKLITTIAPAVVKLSLNKIILSRNVVGRKNNNPIESIFFQMPDSVIDAEDTLTKVNINRYQDSILSLVFLSDQNVRNKYPTLGSNSQLTKEEIERAQIY